MIWLGIGAYSEQIKNSPRKKNLELCCGLWVVRRKIGVNQDYEGQT